MIGDLAVTFVKLCHVLCTFFAIVICSVVASTVGPGFTY